MTTHRYSSHRKPDDTFSKVVAFLIAWPIYAALLMWYNHVWIQWPVSYWQWLALCVPLMILNRSKPMQVCFGVISGVALMAQTAAWVGLLNLPLIHL